MYTDVKNVQILVSLLKQFNIRHLVLSPGNRNVPFVHSVENDGFFSCYSITDERSAGFFAIGLIHQHNEPVAICCTSGTAVCNYASAVNEAYYQKLPLVVITADRNPYYLDQAEDQMISQMDVFAKACKSSVQLPMIKDSLDEWKCSSLINSALLEMNHHGCGPVHINVPIESGLNDFNEEALPQIVKINRIDNLTPVQVNNLVDKLSNKRIMVLYGQSRRSSEAEIANIERFVDTFDAVIAVDLLSNLQCNGCVNTFNACRMADGEVRNSFMPDIVISVNGNFVSYIRNLLKANSGSMEHWLVSESGRVQDPFHCLTTIIESTASEFFEAVAGKTISKKGSNTYYPEWKKLADSISIGNLPYSDMLVTKNMMGRLQQGDCLHLANSSSVRIAQHFDLSEGVQVTCNRGTNGIDGSMSSFIGEACNDSRMHYLLIGDLSFFYDMNALWNRYIGANIRILLNNNEGAEIFHFNVGVQNVPTLNKHIAAEHFYSAKGWAESVGMLYIAVHDESEMEAAFDVFFDKKIDKPVLLEVFTKKDEDARVMKELYHSGKPRGIKDTIRNFLKR